MSSRKEEIEEYSFKSYFIPFTTLKAIHWIAIVGLLVFANSLFNGFVGDDFGQIVSNQTIRDLGNIPLFFKASTFANSVSISGLYYKPLLLTAYAFLYFLFGENAFFFHLFQVMLFISNAILVFLLLQKFIKKYIAFILALLFLVHPINQSVAAYSATLQDTMFFFFGMIALLIGVNAKFKYSQVLVHIFLVLSLLSKETGIGFVFIYFLYLVLFRKEKLRLFVIVSTILVGIYIFLHFNAVGTHFAETQMYHVSRISLNERLFMIPAIIMFYFQTLIFPVSLSVSYDWIVTQITLQSFYLPLGIIFLLLLIAIVIGKQIKQHANSFFRLYIYFFCWLCIGMAFHLQIIPLDGTVSTSWFYFPFVGLLGMLGIVSEMFSKKKNSKKNFLIIGVILLVIFSAITLRRNMDFKDNVTLTCHDASVTTNFALEFSCGSSIAYYHHDYALAQKHIEKSISLAPYYYLNWYALGQVLGTLGGQKHDVVLIKRAEEAFLKSIEYNPSDPFAYEQLGYLYIYFEDKQKTEVFLSSATKRFPTDYKLLLYLAVTKYKMGDKKTAEQLINKSYKLSNNNESVISEWKKLINVNTK